MLPTSRPGRGVKRLGLWLLVAPLEQFFLIRELARTGPGHADTGTYYKDKGFGYAVDTRHVPRMQEALGMAQAGSK